MSTVVNGSPLNPSGNCVLLKGAPERVIDQCATYKNKAGETNALTADDKKKLIDHIGEFSKNGLRCLAIAAIYNGGQLADLNEGNLVNKLGDLKKYSELESGGTFLGVVCIMDPPRDEVKSSIEDCKTAGIRVIMITGDSKETA